MTDAQDFRADDLSALNNLIVSASRFGGSNGPVGNLYSGLGTNRDPQNFSQIVPTRELTPRECIDLYEGDRLFRVLVDALPLRSPAPIWTFGSHEDNDDEINSDDVTKYLDRAARNGNNYGMSSTQQALGQVANSQDLYQFLNPDSGFMNLFRSCAQDARMFKTSYILIGVDDGMDWEEPLNWEGIRSLRWLKHLTFQEITPKDNPSDPEFYEVKVKQGEGTEGSNRNKRLVHQSRVVRLLGHPLPLAAAQIKSCPATSVIQSFYPAYSRLIQCLQSATNMVASHSAFTSGIQGLGEMTKTPEGRQKLFNRLESMMMSMSSLRGIMYDTNGEKVDYINRQYAGIKDIIDIQLDYVTAQSDTPRFLLFGTSNRSGLGAEGRGEQESLQFAQAMRTWVNTHLRDPMLYLGTIALLAEDFPEGNGILPEGFNVEFPSILELDPLSIAKILVEYTEAYTKAAEAGFVDKTEVRRSLFEPASLPLSGTIDLDDRISEMMEEALENSIEGDDEDEDIEDDEEDLEEDDRTTEEESEDIEGEAIDPDDEEDRGDSEWDGFRIDGEDSEPDWWRFDEAYGVFFSGRRTGIFVQANSRSQAISKARKRKRRGGTKVVSVRKPTAQERKIASKGGWSRYGPKGEKPGYNKSKRGYGPALKRRSDSTDIDQRFDIIEKTKSGKFILWNTNRTRVLGTHSSYEEALAQERAIEISKHQKSDESHETTDDSEISEFLSEGDDGDRITLDDLWYRFDSKNEPTDKTLWARAQAEAKKRFRVVPSAYSNLWASRWYKQRGGKWRVKKDAIDIELRSDSVEECFEDLLSEIDVVLDSLDEVEEYADDLRQWLKERWVRISGSGEILPGTCAREPGESKPKCLPLSKARSMSKAERIAAVRRKRREDPNPDRKGKAIHVSTHGKKDEQDTESRSDDSTPVRRVLKWRNGLEIGVQYLPFSKRHGRTITAAYGHIRTLRGADGMALDCWVSTNYADPATKVFVVEQIINGEFDEEKLIIGCYTKEEARSLYIANMPIEMFGGIQEITMQELESRRVAKPLTVDAESIEVSGDILDESEFDELGAIDILATLERIIEGEDV